MATDMENNMASDMERPIPTYATHIQQPSLTAFRDAISDKYNSHIHAFTCSDLEFLLNDFFHEDAIWAGPFPMPNTVVQGREQLKEFFSHVIDCQIIDPVKSIFNFVKGDVGFDCAIYQTRPRPGYQGPNKPESLRFHCTFNWVRIEGDWKVIGVSSYMTPVED